MIVNEVDMGRSTLTIRSGTKAEQNECMPIVRRFVFPTRLLVLVLLLAAWDALASESSPAVTCDVHALMDRQDFVTATACVKNGADPNARDKAGNGPLNNLLRHGGGLSVLNGETLPLLEALVDAGGDLNHRPPGDGVSAFEVLLAEGSHMKARPLVRRMLLREEAPVALNASVPIPGNRSRDELRLTPLLWAIKMGDVEIAALLLKRGADPNHIPRPGMGTPLHHAVSHNQPEILGLLYKHGADVHTVSSVPILDAINGGNMKTEPETLRAALALGAMAAIENHEIWLQRALSSHKPLTEDQFLVLAPYLKIDFANPQSRFLELLLINNIRSVSSFMGTLPALRVAFLHALSSGANPNGSRSHTKVGASLLQILCNLYDVDLSLPQALLEQGADPNLADNDGDTPLHQIALNRAPLEKRLAKLPPVATDIQIPENLTIWGLDKLRDAIEGKPERVEAIKSQELRKELEKRIERLNAYERLLLSKGANATLKNRMGLTPGQKDWR